MMQTDLTNGDPGTEAMRLSATLLGQMIEKGIIVDPGVAASTLLDLRSALMGASALTVAPKVEAKAVRTSPETPVVQAPEVPASRVAPQSPEPVAKAPAAKAPAPAPKAPVPPPAPTTPLAETKVGRLPGIQVPDGVDPALFRMLMGDSSRGRLPSQEAMKERHDRAMECLQVIDPARVKIIDGRLATARELNQAPAVDLKASIKPMEIVCLEDGTRVKMLTSFIRRKFGMTPEMYRAKWELPENYPMIAPEFARQKSFSAKSSGFGTTVRPEALKDGTKADSREMEKA